MTVEILIIVISFFVSLFLVRHLSSGKSIVKIVDVPNKRSMHSVPIPRTGGIGINLSVLLGIAAVVVFSGLSFETVIPLVAGVVLIAVISLLDDIYTLNAISRILVHLGVSLLVVYNGIVVSSISVAGFSFSLAIPLAVLICMFFMAWMINVYNFMDGMDGFAGGMSFAGFMTLAVLYSGAMPEMATICAIVAFSSLGFLLYNYPPARIFMGDSGSTVQGFVAAYMILFASKEGIFPLWVGILVFSPFIVDATYTLISRLISREKIWKAHNRHIYQILANKYLGKVKTLYFEYFVMVLCSFSAIYASHHPESHVLTIILWTAIYTAIIIGVYGFDKAKSGSIN